MKAAPNQILGIPDFLSCVPPDCPRMGLQQASKWEHDSFMALPSQQSWRLVEGKNLAAGSLSSPTISISETFICLEGKCQTAMVSKLYKS